MGGLMMVLVLDVTALLWAQWNTLIQLTLLSVVVLSGLGFLDDYAKITQQNSKGVQEFIKLWVQGALAVFVAIYLWRVPGHQRVDQRGDGSLFQTSGADRNIRRHGGHSSDRPDHRRQFQRRQPDRRPGRPGHRLHGDCLLCISGIDISGGQREGGGLFANPPCRRARAN